MKRDKATKGQNKEEQQEEVQEEVVQPQPLNPTGKKVQPKLRRTRTKISGVKRLSIPPQVNVPVEDPKIEKRPIPKVFSAKARALSKLQDEKLKAKEAVAKKTQAANIKTAKRLYFISKPAEVINYATIYGKLAKCFRSIESSTVYQPVLKARLAVFVCHVSVNMATILSHNIDIFEQYDLTKLVSNKPTRRKGRVLPRKLASTLSAINEVEGKAYNYFGDLKETDSISGHIIVDNLKDILVRFSKLSEICADFANDFYEESNIFKISNDIEDDFKYMPPKVMKLQFESFKKSLSCITKGYKLLNKLEQEYQKDKHILPIHATYEAMERFNLVFLDTVVLSNVKLCHENMSVENNILLQQYFQIIGYEVTGYFTHNEILPHIEFNILYPRKE